MLAWSAKVSDEFVAKVIGIDKMLRGPLDGANYLMACMAFESGETFSPSIRNAAGSGAVGLIQFMPSTAKGLGTSTEALAKMRAEDQLDYVYAYFKPYAGRLRILSDFYMAILWPAAIGRSPTSPLWSAADRPTTYRQNSGLDTNRDGIITVGEAVEKVHAKLLKGLLPENMRG